MTIRFTVMGIPAPQGGSRPVGTAQGPRLITTGGVGLKTWRADVSAEAARQAVRHGCLTLPLSVTAIFRFPMPKSRPAKLRAVGIAPKTTAPDLDKLCRALGDALTVGGLIGDDARIVEWQAQKVEVWQEWTGVLVMLRVLSAEQGVAA